LAGHYSKDLNDKNFIVIAIAIDENVDAIKELSKDVTLSGSN
jgi:hypothetical protein